MLDFIIKMWLGSLKCVELLFMFLVGVCGLLVSLWIYINGSGYGCGCVGKFIFFDFVVWIVFVNVFIDMIFYLIGFWEKLLWFFCYFVLFLVFCGLVVLGFLIGLLLMVLCVKYICVMSLSIVGVVIFFGFVCLVLFVVEFFMYF